MPFWSQLGFSDPITPQQAGIIIFYDHCIFILSFVLIGLLQYIGYLVFNQYKMRYIYENSFLEFCWTLAPILVLTYLVFPSLILLYRLDEGVILPHVTIKVIGSQWHWNYEFRNLKGDVLNYGSYAKPEWALQNGEPRNLTADESLVVPHGVAVRFLISRRDVIHSFSLINGGVKVDCIPGRINIAHVRFDVVGRRIGLCSEFCGTGHYNMPINVEVVPYEENFRWSSVSSTRK